jgi:hypothetical protein
VRARLTWIAGAIGVAGVAAYRKVRRSPAPDPRAEELRDRLAESRAVVEERDEFEAAETPVDEVEPATEVDERRKRVHQKARAATDKMRRPSGE